MPAESQAQRGFIFAKFGPAWAKEHHFDNPGKLPAYAHARGSANIGLDLFRKMQQNCARGSSNVLSTADRKRLAPSSFAVPSKAPGSGSYPIPDPSHARNALSRSSGKPIAAQVRAAVHRKFPSIGQK